MKALASGFLVSMVFSTPLLAQQQYPFREQIRLALERSFAIAPGTGPGESPSPKKLGIFTLVPPTARGEVIRLSVPVGALVSRAFKGAAAANRRRQEAVARREVEAALEWFRAQQRSAKQ